MQDCHDFQFYTDAGGARTNDAVIQYEDLVYQIQTNGPRIEGITLLEFCFSRTTTTPIIRRQGNFVVTTLPYLLPSLREVNFANTCTVASSLSSLPPNRETRIIMKRKGGSSDDDLGSGNQIISRGNKNKKGRRRSILLLVHHRQ